MATNSENYDTRLPRFPIGAIVQIQRSDGRIENWSADHWNDYMDVAEREMRLVPLTILRVTYPGQGTSDGPGEAAEIAVAPLAGASAGGRMEQAVLKDLQRLGALDTGVRGSLAELALQFARAMDSQGEDAPTPAQIAQLGHQLRTTLQALSNVGGQDGTLAQQVVDILSAPVGNAPDPFPADDGSARRANRAATRKTTNALAATRSECVPGDQS